MTEHQPTWLAKQIVTPYPDELGAVNLFTVSCGCIYYQQNLSDGNSDTEYGICRHGSLGPCMECMGFDNLWKERIVDEVAVYDVMLG